MRMSESDQPDSDIRPGTRSNPFQIDLNEAPLPSPREAAAGRKEHGAGFSCRFGVKVCDSCGEAATADEGGRLLACHGCGAESHRRCMSVDSSGELDCFRCLFAKNVNKRMKREMVHFDINASPPREADGESFLGEVPRTAMGALQRERELKAKMHHVNNISTATQSFLTAVIRKANSSCMDNGYLNKTYEVSHSLKTGFQPNVSNGLTRVEGFTASSTSFHHTRYPSEDPGELHFKYLADYIHEKGGTLGNGWHVEFINHEKKPKASAVYCAPDGSRFESMFEVACYLGLIANKTSFENFEGSDKFGPFQRGLHYNRRQTKSGKILRSQNWKGSPDSLQLDSDVDKLSAIEFNTNILERGSGSTRAGFSSHVFPFQHFEDGFPLQFEDFFVLSAGKVDPRPNYHSSSQIWPIGYRSCWHDNLTGSLFLCEILDGGDSGPIFKISRYPCLKYPIPIGSTVLSRQKPEQKDGQGKASENGLSAYEIVDGDSTNLELILSEEASPSLADIDFENMSCLPSEPNLGSEKCAHISSIDLRLHDSINEFSSEGRSASLAWETVLQTLFVASQETFEKTGVLQFFCNHSPYLVSQKASENLDSLSKFGNSCSPIDIPHVIRSEPEFKTSFAYMRKWLQEDRLGLNAEFVQEILEKLPGVNSLSEYICISKRSQDTMSQTVGSGFLHAKRTTTFTPYNRGADSFPFSRYRRLSHAESSRAKCFPLGKPLSSKLPVHLVGDVLQVWEFLWHFTKVLGLEEQFSFQQLENELVNPWPDRHNMADEAEKDIQNVDVTNCTGVSLRRSHTSLLKIVVGELLVKVAAYMDPSFKGGEQNSNKDENKDSDNLSKLKKAEFDLLQINEITWPELARRYILLTLFTNGNLDSTETIHCESGTIFHCLQGDGGTLCGSLTGVTGMEAEAKFLAEATKKIFGLMKTNDLVVSRNKEPHSGASQIIPVGCNEDEPEWMQALEPVRKLPTNVGARIKKCVHEALEKNPPDWAKEIMKHSLSKNIYKGNASGPTKKIIVSLLSDSGSTSIQPSRPERKEKVKSVIKMSDLIMKKCRNVLRQAVSADGNKVFCNLLGSTLLNPSDNDDEGTLGYPAMVSQPIDFRTVDIRLATGVYNGSHEAFLEDVRTVWYNVRKTYSDQHNLMTLAEKMSRKFEDMFQKEVLPIVQKVEESRTNATNDGSHSELEDMLLRASEIPLTEAPWEDGLCKVCGVDRDDDNVLLCDSCDSEYHTYCLNPPLARIPDGNWYCPSCAAKKNSSQGGVRIYTDASCSQKKISQGPKHDFLKALAGLAKSMEAKEYWELSLEERVFLLKFLCDESLNTFLVRDHLEKHASTSADLQEKLSVLSSDLLTANLARGNSMQNNVGVLPTEESNVLKGDTRVTDQIMNQNDRFSSFYSDSPQVTLSPSESAVQISEGLKDTDGSVSVFKSSQVEQEVLKDVPNILTNDHQTVSEANGSVSKLTSLDTLKKEVSAIEDSIALIESELLRISVRKEYLGKDSSDRVYWGFIGPRNSPFVVANKAIEEQTPMKKLGGISTTWFCYQGDEIKELLGWLEDGSSREGELKESILQWQRSMSKESSNASDTHSLKLKLHSYEEAAQSCFVESRALSSLKRKCGPLSNIQCEDKMYRCACLELIWPSRSHCISCHMTFSNREELQKHLEVICSGSSPESETKVDRPNKRKKIEKSVEKSRGKKEVSKGSKSEKLEMAKLQSHPECPFNLKEIIRNFPIQNSLKELVSSLGFIGSNGIPKFVANKLPHMNDPSLTLATSVRRDENDLGLAEEGAKQESAIGASLTAELIIGRSNANVEAPKTEIPKKNKGQRVDVRCIIPKSALRQLVGRVSYILRQLKIKLLDIEAALPREAIRPSMASFEKTSTWRAFVKSAGSIYQMVQATVMLEQMLRSDYLKNDWWNCTSISAAASTATVSSLARRICSLDAALSYENSLPSAPTVSTTVCPTPKSVESDKSGGVSQSKKRKNLSLGSG